MDADNGNQMPWQLMIRLLLRECKVDPSKWKELAVHISEPMQVIMLYIAYACSLHLSKQSWQVTEPVHQPV